jgi:hypothetical protein
LDFASVKIPFSLFGAYVFHLMRYWVCIHPSEMLILIG